MRRQVAEDWLKGYGRAAGCSPSLGLQSAAALGRFAGRDHGYEFGGIQVCGVGGAQGAS
jgi:hypothetical protein